jgi:hypothetical protein
VSLLILFQNPDGEEEEERRRRRKTLVIIRDEKQVLSPLEEWKREPEPVLSEHDLKRALEEDEEMLLFWD